MSTVFRRVFLGAVVSLLPCGVIGCGGEIALAPVRGTVTCNGKALAGGQISFLPGAGAEEGSEKVGKSAAGIIAPDGTFTLKTGMEDGAVIGSHRVSIYPPAAAEGVEIDSDDLEESGEEGPEDDPDQVETFGAAAKQSKLPCEAPQGLIIEVTAGENVFKIEMSGGKVERVPVE